MFICSDKYACGIRDIFLRDIAVMVSEYMSILSFHTHNYALDDLRGSANI